MQIDGLTRMANQIADFFAPYPVADAVEGVHDHLLKFWDPIMRGELAAVDDARFATLHPLVQQVVERLRADVTPTDVTP